VVVEGETVLGRRGVVRYQRGWAVVQAVGSARLVAVELVVRSQPPELATEEQQVGQVGLLRSAEPVQRTRMLEPVGQVVPFR
jgi:hypothetical protein